MPSKFHCYVRTKRREWALTQDELASLVGTGTRTRVSDLELQKTEPSAVELLAYPLIFGEPVEAIFPRLFEEVEDAVARGAYTLHERLKKDSSEVGSRKRALLEDILARLAARPKEGTA